MEKVLQLEIDDLKKKYLSLEQTYQNEKECLLKVANTFGLIVDMSPEYREFYRKIKPMLQNESALSVEHVHQETSNLRSSIFSEEMKTIVETGDTDPEKAQHNQLLEAYKLLDKIVIALTDDFYPIDDEAKQKVDAISFDFRNGMSASEFNKTTKRLLTYIDKLKEKISDDFRYINNTFLSFFNQVRELEIVLTKEFHEDGHNKGLKYSKKKSIKKLVPLWILSACIRLSAMLKTPSSAGFQV